VLIDYESLGLSDRRTLGGLHDSKQMTCEDRERLYPNVLRAATRVSVVIRCVRGIDRRGLHNTNIEALSSALQRVACDGAVCLVDGFRLPRCEVRHRAVVDGDATSAAIAAASVIAKVSRDRYMHKAEAAYPGWGFEENVGYSTPEHRAAILANGISALHRRSFQSIAYSQLALGGDTIAAAAPPDLPVAAPDGHRPDSPEGITDVVEVPDGSVAPEGDADRVEADLAVAGDPGLGEPGSGEGTEPALLEGADSEDGAARAA
jgi:ribonuclease HII